MNFSFLKISSNQEPKEFVMKILPFPLTPKIYQSVAPTRLETAPTWIIHQQFGSHPSKLVVSYGALHQPYSYCGGSHLHRPKNTSRNKEKKTVLFAKTNLCKDELQNKLTSIFV